MVAFSQLSDISEDSYESSMLNLTEVLISNSVNSSNRIFSSNKK